MLVGDEFWGEAPPPLLPPRTERAALWILDAVRDIGEIWGRYGADRGEI